MIKSRTKTEVKKLIAALQTDVKQDIQSAFKNAVRAIDKAASKGVFHKKTASRKKSRLAILVNKHSA